MASARKPLPEREYLAELERQIAELQAEAGRLSRRLRNIRSAVLGYEEGLGAIAASIEARIAALDSPRPR